MTFRFVLINVQSCPWSSWLSVEGQFNFTFDLAQTRISVLLMLISKTDCSPVLLANQTCLYPCPLFVRRTNIRSSAYSIFHVTSLLTCFDIASITMISSRWLMQYPWCTPTLIWNFPVLPTYVCCTSWWLHRSPCIFIHWFHESYHFICR